MPKPTFTATSAPTLLLLFSPLLTLAQNVTGANFVLNGGFEEGVLSPWTCSSSDASECGLETTSTNGFPNSGSTNAILTSNAQLSQPLAIEAGNYKLVFSVYCFDCTGSANNFGVSLGRTDRFGTAQLGSPLFGPYRVFASDIKAGKGDTLRFTFSDVGTLRIDDVSLTAQANPPQANSSNIAEIAGGVAGGVCVLLVIVIIFYLNRRRGKKQKAEEREREKVTYIPHSQRGRPSWIRPLDDQQLRNEGNGALFKDLPALPPKDGHRTYPSQSTLNFQIEQPKFVTSTSSYQIHRSSQSWSQINRTPFSGQGRENFSPDIVLPAKSIDINRPPTSAPSTLDFRTQSISPPLPQPQISILDSDQYSMRTTNMEYVTARSRPLEERDFYPQYPRLPLVE